MSKYRLGTQKNLVFSMKMLEILVIKQPLMILHNTHINFLFFIYNVKPQVDSRFYNFMHILVLTKNFNHE